MDTPRPADLYDTKLAEPGRTEPGRPCPRLIAVRAALKYQAHGHHDEAQEWRNYANRLSEAAAIRSEVADKLRAHFENTNGHQGEILSRLWMGCFWLAAHSVLSPRRILKNGALAASPLRRLGWRMLRFIATR
jgi:hypothetical protein